MHCLAPPPALSKPQDMMAHNIFLNSTASSQYNAGGVRQRSGSRTECALLEFAQSLMALEAEGVGDGRWQGARVLQVRCMQFPGRGAREMVLRQPHQARLARVRPEPDGS